MNLHSVRPPRPWWVTAGLLGLPDRTSAVTFMWITAGIALACLAYGLVDRRYLIGVALLAATYWYWAAIQWVDRHGSWT